MPFRAHLLNYILRRGQRRASFRGVIPCASGNMLKPDGSEKSISVNSKQGSRGERQLTGLRTGADREHDVQHGIPAVWVTTAGLRQSASPDA